MFLKRLDHELHLTDSQKTQVLSVLDNRRDKIVTYEDQVRQETRLEIRSHLMTNQQPIFDAMVARHDAQRRKEEDR